MDINNQVFVRIHTSGDFITYRRCVLVCMHVNPFDKAREPHPSYLQERR